MSDSYQQQQAGWEWSQEDEQRWELAATPQPMDQSVKERMLADFDSIFMNEGE